MRLISRWARWPPVDLILAGAAVGGYRLGRSAGLDPIVVQPGQHRLEIYHASLAASGAVMAFAVVPAAIILALAPGRRLAHLLKRYPSELRRATVAAAGTSLASLGGGVSAIALDGGSSSNSWVRHLVVFLLLAELSAGARLIDLFSQLLKTISHDGQAEGYDPVVGPIRPVQVPDVPEGTEVRLGVSISQER